MEESKELKNNRRIKISILVMCAIAVIICIVLTIIKDLNSEKKNDIEPTPTPGEVVNSSGNFTIDMIKAVNKDNVNNYLISPYNMEMALNMLRDGADGNTKAEIDKVIGNRTIQDVSLDDKIGVANGIFIKNKYQDHVKKDYVNILDKKYNSEIIYDEFNTPDKINNWVNEKTKGMIPKILDNVDEEFILGLASALAIDVKWKNSFECIGTSSEEFTKIDNSKINVEMMHQTYENNAQYIKTDDAIGIILPYYTGSNSIELEFVGILPDENISNYIDSITKEKIDSLFNNTKEASNKLHIHLSLPRFTYDYNFNDFGNSLKSLGIKDVFNPSKANLSKMVDVDAYVSTAIHKTHIELNEEGTKAAAITYFGVEASGMIEQEEYEEINVKFNKPFIYMIREKNSKEILFFGGIFEPNVWKGSTCSKVAE